MDSTATTDDSAPDARPDDGATASTPAAAPAHPLSASPPLSRLATLGGLVTLLVHGVLLPGFGSRGDHSIWLKVGRWGDFGQNLAAVAGVVALLTGVRGFVAHNHHLRIEKRWLLVVFSLIFAGTMAAATISERNTTSGELVWLALGEANLLSVILAVSVLSLAPGRTAFGLVLAVACMALFGLTARVLELLALRLGGWVGTARDVFEAVGEVGYLVTLVIGTIWISPRGSSLRDSAARFSGLVVLGMVGAVFVIGALGPEADFKLLLYHAQRVRLLLESVPWLYAVPVAMACGAAVAAVGCEDPIRRQAGAGMLLLVASGYAPRAPAGLLTLTLAVCLLARATLASTWRVSHG